MAELSSFVLPAADDPGTVAGRVLDAQAGNGHPGAAVRLEGTRHEAVTDRDGSFRIGEMPDGEYTLVVTYLGYETQRQLGVVTVGRNFFFYRPEDPGLVTTR
jgi:hypothetical protein